MLLDAAPSSVKWHRPQDEMPAQGRTIVVYYRRDGRDIGMPAIGSAQTEYVAPRRQVFRQPFQTGCIEFFNVTLWAYIDEVLDLPKR